MSDPSTSPGHVNLRADRDADASFLIHPENDDIFIRTGKQVIASCQLGISIEVWLTELQEMLDHVTAWARGHANQIRAVVAAPRGSRTGLFVVPIGDQFDFDMADTLVDLEGELMRKFNVGMIEILQVPGDDLKRFIHPESARVLYGEPRSSHPPVAS